MLNSSTRGSPQRLNALTSPCYDCYDRTSRLVEVSDNELLFQLDGPYLLDHTSSGNTAILRSSNLIQVQTSGYEVHFTPSNHITPVLVNNFVNKSQVSAKEALPKNLVPSR